jgi:hypothetical protein
MIHFGKSNKHIPHKVCEYQVDWLDFSVSIFYVPWTYKIKIRYVGLTTGRRGLICVPGSGINTEASAKIRFGKGAKALGLSRLASWWKIMLDDIYQRICKRLEATGLSAREACRRAGIGLDFIRNIKRALDGEKPARVGVSTRTIAALAPVLGTTVDWLLTGVPSAEGGELLFVDWAQLGGAVESAAFRDGRRLGDEFGRWPSSYIATRTPDNAMNRVAPLGSYIVLDRNDRVLVDGGYYLGRLDGSPVFRRWRFGPDRAEPCSTDPDFRIEFIGGERHWMIIGRVRRAILEL